MDHHNMDDDMCSMTMLFTWSTKNLCIIFPSWHVRSTASLLWSLLAIIALTAGYEAVREVGRRVEAGAFGVGAAGGVGGDYDDEEHDSLLRPVLGRAGAARTRRGASKTLRGALYAVQVFYSFFIMLLFMTYNGWVMLAVAVGAFVGFMLFGAREPGSGVKSVACH